MTSTQQRAGVAGGGAVRALTWRLIRRSALAIGLGMGIYVGLEGFAFTTGYPDAEARHNLTRWGQDPSIRMIAGPAIAVETVGGFIVWDAGLYFTLILGAWALTTTTRVLRGDEAAGRTDLLLLGPLAAVRALLQQVAVLAAAAVGVGACVSIGFLAAGAQPQGSLLFGAWITCYLLVLITIATLASQLFDARGAAVGSAGALLLSILGGTGRCKHCFCNACLCAFLTACCCCWALARSSSPAGPWQPERIGRSAISRSPAARASG